MKSYNWEKRHEIFKIIFLGQSLLQLGKTAIPHQYKPLMLCKGIMYCQTQSGQIGSILLESHKTQIAVDDKSFAEVFYI